jgi:hypothetical protein
MLDNFFSWIQNVYVIYFKMLDFFNYDKFNETNVKMVIHM